jgi:hypothetical protein
MAPRFATDTFSIVIGGASHLVVIGSHRDSTHPAVAGAPGLFTTVPLASPQISTRLTQYLQSYPDGPQI